MLAALRTATVVGLEACPVQVEVDVSPGLPSFTVVGLPDPGVRESRDRVRSAIRNSGYEFPPHRITINLAPADVRKAGALFDLPVALGILAAIGVVRRRQVDDFLLLGELSLDGGIQPTRGVLPIAMAARRSGVPGVLLPAANAREAAIVGSLEIVAVETLAQAVEALNGTRPVVTLPPEPCVHQHGHTADFADVRGQLLVRRALEVAAAGGHNVLMVGPPGSGKSMMARRLPGILPPLTHDEALESTAVHSVCGLLPPGTALLNERPFRAPHHTISPAALVGGGTLPRAGEISLAHNGVLFLDELPEFDRRSLEVLRQPLELGTVTVARAARTIVFPARFMLVAAMNPCPCGYLGHPTRACRCTTLDIDRYRNRISGPLRDRLDLIVSVPPVAVSALTAPAAGEPSAAIRARVLAARERQRLRFDGRAVTANAHLYGRLLWSYCRPDPAGLRLLEAAAERLGLSARGFDRILRVARSIADLAGSAGVLAAHIAEALQYRLQG